MTPFRILGMLTIACTLTLAGGLAPAYAGSVRRIQSEDAAWKKDTSYQALKKAFQKVAGPHILSDGYMVAWEADEGEIADSGCEVSVGHRSWGKATIQVSNAVCDSLGGGALGYSVLLSRDKKYLGLVVQWGAGSSGAISYQLITFKRTHTPIEAGKDDYYGKIKSQWL